MRRELWGNSPEPPQKTAPTRRRLVGDFFFSRMRNVFLERVDRAADLEVEVTSCGASCGTDVADDLSL